MKNLISETKKNLWRTGRNHEGFTLIEVVISMLILSVGISGLIKTSALIIFHQNNSRLVTEATLLTTSEIEKIKHFSTNEPAGGSFGFSYLVTDYLTDEGFTEVSNQEFNKTVADRDFTVTTTLQVYPSSSSKTFDDPALLRMLDVVIRTAWTDNRGTSKNVEMATLIRRRQFVE